MNEQVMSHWAEWKTKCALQLCGPDAQDALRDFLWQHGLRMTAKMQLSLIDYFEPPSRAEEKVAIPNELNRAKKGKDNLWAYLEHRALAGVHQNGKSYKDWIFSHASHISDENHALAAILQGVKLQLQMVLRDVLADEISLRKERRNRRSDEGHSFEQPADTNAWLERAAQKAEELLNPSATRLITLAEKSDYDNIADQIAREFMASATLRDKVVLWAKLHDVSLADKRIIAAAGIEKSQLYTCCNAIDEWLRAKIEQFHEDDGGAYFLRAAVLHNLLDRITLWNNSEKLLCDRFSD